MNLNLYVKMVETFKYYNADFLSKYIIGSNELHVNPRRMVLETLIVDVDNLQLCSSIIGDSAYWFDLNRLFNDFNIDKDRFKSLLELYNLGLVTLRNIDESLFRKSFSLTKLFISSLEEQSVPILKIISLVVNSVADQEVEEFYKPSTFAYKPKRMALQFYYLCRLKGFDYFFNFVNDNYDENYLIYILKELNLHDINPKMYKELVQSGNDIFLTLRGIIKHDSYTKSTEVFVIMEDIFTLLGGV